MLAIPESAMTRRRFLASMTLMAGVVCFAQRDLFAAPENLVEKARASAAKQKITVQKLRGNVSVLMGAGGNIGVLAGRDGKLLVDAGYVGARPTITDAFAAISSDPIKHLINTHWHFDHTDGNEWLHNTGAAIVAHENPVSTFPPILGLRHGTSLFLLHRLEPFRRRPSRTSTKCT